MQLLTGAAAEPAQPREATTAVAAPTELADLAARIDALTRDVESLKAAVAAIAAHRRDPAPSAE
jgi:outer membrane murein-binding lipoprotein Lpp